MEEQTLLRGKRLGEAIEYLRSTKRIKTQEELADKVGCSANQISRAKAGNKKDMTSNLVGRINHKFDEIFNEEYIWNGKGTLLAHKDEQKKPADNTASIPMAFSLNKEGDNMASIVSGFLSELSRRSETIATLEQEKKEKDEAILWLRKQIEEKDNTIALLRKQLEEYIKDSPQSKKETSDMVVNM